MKLFFDDESGQIGLENFWTQNFHKTPSSQYRLNRSEHVRTLPGSQATRTSKLTSLFSNFLTVMDVEYFGFSIFKFMLMSMIRKSWRLSILRLSNRFVGFARCFLALFPILLSFLSLNYSLEASKKGFPEKPSKLESPIIWSFQIISNKIIQITFDS